MKLPRHLKCMPHTTEDPSPDGPSPATSGRLRRLLALVVFAGSMAVFASPAMAAGGAISGTVTNNAVSPTPLDGICAEALNPTTGKVVSDVLTNSSGQYTIAGLAAGSYKVEFYDCGTTGYITQYYSNQSSLASAGAVSVTTGSTTSAINAKMVLGGKITGLVTNNASTPAPLANICVLALNSSNSSVASARTDSSGHYSLLRLPTGSYKVEFYDCSGAGYLDQFYNDQPSLTTANPVAVTAGTTKSAINAKMVLGGKITGTVTNNAATPVPLANVCAAAYPAAGGLSVGSTYTNSSGQYTIIGLPTGSYKVEFYQCTGTGYLTQYYKNEPSLASANAVSVTVGSTTSGIGAKMVLGGKITGTVTNASTTAPLANICVDVFQASSSSFVTTVQTNSLGEYTVGGVPGGSYKLEFFDCAVGIYVSQYYNNQATLAAANPVSVTGGSTTAGINAKLLPGGKISGTVTDSSTHQPVSNICVDALKASTGTFVGGARTNSSGQYTITSLPVGSYKIEFIDCSGSGYLTTYYTADPVSVASFTTTSGINQALVQL